MWWKLNDKTESKTEYLARVKYEGILCKTVSNFNEILKENNFEENVQYRIVTEKSFNAIVVIEYLLKFFEIDEVVIAVYRMNQQSVNRLKMIIDDQKCSTTILLSSFFRQNKNYEKWCHDLISYSDSIDNSQVKFAWNHAKVFLAKTKCNKHIVFEGSGNLSDNARIEQYILENNKQTYEFHKKWITQVANSN